MNFMSKDIGIDLGTGSTRIFVKGKGIVLNEPTVVAINNITSEVLSAGASAKEMIGRTPDNIIAVRPLKEGVIADFECTRMLLETLINKVTKKSIFTKPRIVVSVPFGITDVEERAVEGVMYKAGAKEVYLVESVMAAAIGTRLNLDEAIGTMIVDIGAGTCNTAVLSLGGIVVSKSIRIGGENLDKDIVEYIKDKYNMLISIVDAENIKINIASAYETMTEDKIEIKARNLNTGLPEDITVTTNDIKEAIENSLSMILKVVKETLEITPPELISDIMENGLTFTGGGANIKDIDRYFSEQLSIPVHISSNPENMVIKGLGMTLENIEVLKKSIKTKKR